jgi:cellulose synthase/poly-beta-1,6-N-acetylglucosamine synthase-like glycosyltransferase
MGPSLILLLSGTIAILGYTYLIYPILIKLISLFFNKTNIKHENILTVSILISAYNEEKVIEQKIENISRLNYDFNKVEVLIGSDCSEDNTNKILEECKKRYKWLSVYLFDERRGKALVLNDLVKNSKNDILVFSDADTIFDLDILTFLSSHFNDQKVGGVSGRIILSEPKKNFNPSIEEKLYWGYEDFIKNSEGKCGIVISANGGNYAIRRNLFINIPTEKAVTDDLFTTLAILKQGFKFLNDYNAVAYEDIANEVIDEYKRKIRYAATNFQTLAYFQELVFNKNILISLALWSHKIFRWITPILFFLILFFNSLLYNYNKYINIFLYMQLAFYLFALLGYILQKYRIRFRFFTFPFYFVFTNIAMSVGFINFVFGKHTAYWQSTPRN